jgi:hypothetical protein
MGAVIERLSRASGHTLNVRQYGWPGANAPTFLAAADSLLRARNPAWVAVVLNSYNIGVNALKGSNRWSMEVAPDYSFRLIYAADPRRTDLTDTLLPWAQRSALVLGLRRRLGLVRNRLALERTTADNSEEAARVPRATVLGLKKAYGPRLLIVYAPADVFEGVEPIEKELLRLGMEQGVEFLSVRAALARDRDEYSRLSRGFHNTAPGVGHFNVIGHKIIGEEIWRYLDVHAPLFPPR